MTKHFEQVAGDLIKPANDEDRQAKIIATNFIALSRRFASSTNEPHLTIDDTIDNLGLSISCAHCHDHKFDAIPGARLFRLARNIRVDRLRVPRSRNHAAAV